MWYVYTMQQYSAIKKEWNLATYNMDGATAYYAKQNKSEKDKYQVTSLTCEI